MTEAIIEVGPGTIRGPGHVPVESASIALECIDDDVVVVGDHPVRMAELWREVIRSAAGSSAVTVLLVYPAWWTGPQVELVCDAARCVAADVVAVPRTQLLGDVRTRESTVVEIAPEFVVVFRSGSVTAVVPRLGDSRDVTIAVAAEVGTPERVLVDAPAGVEGALETAIGDRLHAAGVAVSIIDPDWVLRAGALRAPQRRRPTDFSHATRPGGHRGTLLAGVLVSVATVCAGLAVRHGGDAPARDVPMTLLVEGRVGVKVPARWRVQRIVSGPGSSRVQVVSPSDIDIAVNITQSPIPTHQTPAMVAATLRKAIHEQPVGVFVDFNPADRRAGRAVASYREIREDHHTRWVVVVDESVRIGIGCQSAPDREQLVRYACDEAIGSAHAVF